MLRDELAAAKLLVSVGDAVTERSLRMGIPPAIQVVDGREKRAKRQVPTGVVAHELRLRNPAGALSDEAFMQMARAYAAPRPVRVVVDGEEDLLALIPLARYPLGTVLVYGQPDEGLVVVRVNRVVQQAARRTLRAMGVPSALLRPRSRKR